MNLADVFRYAVGALVGHRLRTALSVMGMAVGIAAVISLTALGEGARRYVTDQFTSLGSNLLVLLPGRVETTGAMPVGGVTHDITLADFRSITARVPAVRAAAPLVVGSETIRYGDRGRNVPVLGTTPDLVSVRHITLASGSFLPERDIEQGGNEMVLGPKVARELFGEASPLGEVVRMGAWRFRVTGVIAPRGRTMMFDLDDVVFIPVRTAMSAFNKSSIFRVLMEVRVREDMGGAKRQVLSLMIERHGVEDVTVIAQDSILSTFSDILRALTLALGGIASISLAVAGVGIMNVMLVSVTERRPEIGLLKAMGATGRQILGAFLAEALLLSCAGGAGGLAAGGAVVYLLTRIYPEFPASPPPWAIAASLALSVAVGVTFGIWPAIRASRLDPVSALSRR